MRFLLGVVKSFAAVLVCDFVAQNLLKKYDEMVLSGEITAENHETLIDVIREFAQGATLPSINLMDAEKETMDDHNNPELRLV